ESRCTADQRPGGTQLVESTARDISFGCELVSCSGPIEEKIGGNSFPECAQLCDALLGRVAGDNRGIDGTDRDASNPVRVEIVFCEGLVDSRLVGAKRAAALEEQSDALKWWTGSRATRPISYNVIHCGLRLHRGSCALMPAGARRTHRACMSACAM